MKLIIKHSLANYDQNGGNLSSQELLQFVEQHELFNNTMSSILITEKINEEISARKGAKSKEVKQLGLYLKEENNKLIFSIFEHILQHPKGINYEQLAKKVNTDIINISHYCCKLKKLQFIDWNYKKDGVIVFPKTSTLSRQQTIKLDQAPTEKVYFYDQLPMTDNIWLNISSYQAVSQGGLTNEEIKLRIMKGSENKMVRRIVDNLKGCEKTAEREGKVFEFRFKNQTSQIKNEIDKFKKEDTTEEGLIPQINDWLRTKFPELASEENILLSLINDKLKDYHSSLGMKKAKRQCTPLKLNRYVLILNYLHFNGAQSEPQLKKLIIEQQKNNSVGIMHKRSLIGIIEGLTSLEIIKYEGYYYYPCWIQKQELRERQQSKENEPVLKLGLPKKKRHLNESLTFMKITHRTHQLEVFSSLLDIIITSLLNKRLKNAFSRIYFARRKKNPIKFQPQRNILHFIDRPQFMPKTTATDYEGFMNEIEDIIKIEGTILDPAPEMEDQLVRYIRKNPMKYANTLRIKYGKNWVAKFEPLVGLNYISCDEEKGIRTIMEPEKLLI